jgi:hypothetical protein
MRWLELNADGFVTNVIVWDGVSPYTPTGVSQLLPCADNVGVSYGWQLVNGVWISPPVEDTEETTQP